MIYNKHKNTKYLQNTLRKNVKDLSTENFQILLKEMKET